MEICKLTGLEDELTKPLLTRDQFDVSMKIINNLTRYERKRRIAARMIGAQKKRLCEIACCGECLANFNKKLIKENESLKSEITELNEEIKSLTARLAEESEANRELSDNWFILKGENSALKWAFEKMIKYQ